MKTAIIYISSHGTTEKVAFILKEKLNDLQPILIDLKKERAPSLAQFDNIIIGGSIHAGIIKKRLTDLLLNNKEILTTKKLGLFLCHGYDGEKAQVQFNNAYSEELRDKAIAKGLFGGEFLFDKMNFFERFLTKKIVGITESKSQIDFDAINQFTSSYIKSI